MCYFAARSSASYPGAFEASHVVVEEKSDDPANLFGHTNFQSSRYVMDGVTRWLPRWKMNGWRTTDRKPVKNDDLWRALDALVASHHTSWKWVAGHSGHPENERADALARAALERERKM